MTKLFAAAPLVLCLVACGDDGDTNESAANTMNASSGGSAMTDTMPDTTPGTTGDAGTDTDATAQTSSSGGDGPPMLRGVRLDMSGLVPHLDQRMEFRVVNAADVMIFNGVLTAVPDMDYSWIMPSSTPVGEGFRLDFFADISGNGLYDAPPTDHAWSVEIPAEGMEPLSFAHNTEFVDIGAPQPMPMGGDFTLNLTDFDPHVGGLFEARVYMAESGRLAGRFVMTSMGGANPTVTIPGIILDGTEYRVDFFADINGNGAYDAPPMDHAWRVMGTGGAAGLTVDFPHDAEWTDVGF